MSEFSSVNPNQLQFQSVSPYLHPSEVILLMQIDPKFKRTADLKESMTDEMRNMMYMMQNPSYRQLFLDPQTQTDAHPMGDPKFIGEQLQQQDERKQLEMLRQLQGSGISGAGQSGGVPVIPIITGVASAIPAIYKGIKYLANPENREKIKNTFKSIGSKIKQGWNKFKSLFHKGSGLNPPNMFGGKLTNDKINMFNSLYDMNMDPHDLRDGGFLNAPNAWMQKGDGVIQDWFNRYAGDINNAETLLSQMRGKEFVNTLKNVVKGTFEQDLLPHILPMSNSVIKTTASAIADKVLPKKYVELFRKNEDNKGSLFEDLTKKGVDYVLNKLTGVKKQEGSGEMNRKYGYIKGLRRKMRQLPEFMENAEHFKEGGFSWSDIGNTIKKVASKGLSLFGKVINNDILQEGLSGLVENVFGIPGEAVQSALDIGAPILSTASELTSDFLSGDSARDKADMLKQSVLDQLKTQMKTNSMITNLTGQLSGFRDNPYFQELDKMTGNKMSEYIPEQQPLYQQEEDDDPDVYTPQEQKESENVSRQLRDIGGKCYNKQNKFPRNVKKKNSKMRDDYMTLKGSGKGGIRIKLL